MDTYFVSLREEVLNAIKNSVEAMYSSGQMSHQRREEIEKFVESRFGVAIKQDVIEKRVNEALDRFPELYTVLTNINISKYR